MKILLIILLASKAFSQGLFVGGQGGGVYQQQVHKYGVTGQGPAATNMQGIGGAVGLNGGYLQTIGKTLIGGEGYATMYTGKTNCDLRLTGGAVEGKAESKHNYGAGLAALAGMWINPKFALYGRAGIELNGFKVSWSGFTIPNAQTKNFTKKITTIVPGMGGVYKINDKLYIAGEYRYPLFRKMSLNMDVDQTIQGNIVIPAIHRSATLTTTEHQVFLVLRKIF